MAKDEIVRDTMALGRDCTGTVGPRNLDAGIRRAVVHHDRLKHGAACDATVSSAAAT
jgi:hypothetical protein